MVTGRQLQHPSTPNTKATAQYIHTIRRKWAIKNTEHLIHWPIVVLICVDVQYRAKGSDSELYCCFLEGAKKSKEENEMTVDS